MARELLSERQVSTAKPREKSYRLHDGGGLALYIAPSGTRSWQFRYRLPGANPGEAREQTLSLGKFPDLTLAAARAAAADARRRAATGEHLTAAKREARATRAARSATTFAKVADRWMAVEAKRAGWTPDYCAEVAASLRNHLSALDALPIDRITASIAAPHLRASEAKAPDMAAKVRARLRAIFDFAVEDGIIRANPIPQARRRRNGPERRHLPAELDRARVGAILRAADAMDVSRGVRRAHLMVAFTVQRISEVANAEWSEFDLDAALWSIPRSRMKKKDGARGPHVVPLPPGLSAMLREWQRADGPGAKWVCPAPTRDAPITIDAAEKFYRRALGLSGQHSPHSWRSVFSTWARDAGRDGDTIEAQLDHVVGGKVAQAYDRAKRLDLRRALMGWYEQQLIAARDGAQVVPMKKRGA